MRQVKYFVASSLDNFISRQDGSVDWLLTDQDYGMAEFFGSVDVAAMGRKTFERMLELSPQSTTVSRDEALSVFANSWMRRRTSRWNS